MTATSDFASHGQWPIIGPVAHDDTCRLIPGQYAETTEHALTALADSADDLGLLIQLAAATSSRHQAQEEHHPQGLGRTNLVFGTPYSKIVNGAFTYGGQGARFHAPGPRGAWYCALDVATCMAEVAYHRIIHLYETRAPTETDIAYRLYRADIRAQEFALLEDDHPRTIECLDPTSYIPGQQLGEQLLHDQRGGVRYSSVRHANGVCLAVLQASIVSNVRLDHEYFLTVENYQVASFKVG